MAVDLSKVMDLADGLEIYKDLRDRIKNIPVPEVPVVGLLINNIRMPINENKYIKFGAQNGIQLTMDEVGGNTVFNLEADLRDVQINGTTIRSQGIANIPLASGSTLGVVKTSMTYGFSMVDGCIALAKATDAQVKAGNNNTTGSNYRAITPGNLKPAVFYGLADSAGDSTQKNSSNAVGTYTDEAKQAIQKMLGLDGILGDFESTAVASKAYAIGETFVYNGKRYRATAAIAISDVIAPGTNCVLDPLDGKYVKDTDIASDTVAGVVKVGDGGAGITLNAAGRLRTLAAYASHIKAGTDPYRPIVPEKQHESVFFGLSKLAGVDLANETVTVGTYPEASKAAILTMLGAIGKTEIAGTEKLGLVMVNPNWGVTLESETGKLYINAAPSTLIKSGTNAYRSIVPGRQHESVYYALAKLAGADMASLTGETIGVYPQAQKTAIQTMLGIEADIPLVETVTGAIASITGMPNVRYICDTAISELTITPPASGSIVVRFTAGSNCIVALPQTVKLPEWFDISSLEAGTTYEIIITDGVYGGVMSWA